MKGFLSLLIIIGGVVSCWMNWDKINDLLASHNITLLRGPKTSESSSAGSQLPVGTPHPATQARAQAMTLYPGLAVANSALNQKFVVLYKEAEANHSPILTHADWPLALAEKAMVSLGGAPMARTSSPQVKATKQVVIYTTSECPYCKQAKQFLARKGVPFREVNIDMSLTGKDDFNRLGGSGVPLIMVGDHKIQGFNQEALERLL